MVAGAGWQIASPDLKVDPGAGAFDDGIDPGGLVGRGLEDAVHGIEAEPQDIAVIFSRPPHVPDAEDRRRPPLVIFQAVLLQSLG
jgi:hypothetical protein